MSDSNMDDCLNNPLKIPTIICAAVHVRDNKKYVHQPINIDTGYVICGRRHHNCFMSYSILSERWYTGIVKTLRSWRILKRKPRNTKQGFVTSDNRFVTREEAGLIAFNAKQISKPTNFLFSEDLY